ncbi:hypothetical protein E2320_001457 [Naja naja]|nr:hypothetical protein E2320_001457 [Naja naja]
MEPDGRAQQSHRRRLLLGDAEGSFTRWRSLDTAGSTESCVERSEAKDAPMKRMLPSDSTDSGLRESWPACGCG